MMMATSVPANKKPAPPGLSAAAAELLLQPGELLLVPDSSAVVQAPSIGSSLVVVLFDRMAVVSVLAHVMLPDSQLNRSDALVRPGEQVVADEEETLPAQFADWAIPAAVDLFLQAGAQKVQTTVRLVGGAQMFTYGGGAGNPLNVGSRNAIACRALLTRAGLRVERSDIGGNRGRSLTYMASQGRLEVSLIGGRAYDL